MTVPTDRDEPAPASGPTWRQSLARFLTTRPVLDVGFATGAWRLAWRPLRAWLTYHGALVEDLDRAFRKSRSPKGWLRAFEALASEHAAFARDARQAGAHATALHHQTAAALYAQIAPYFVVGHEGTRERFLRWSEDLYRSAVSVPGTGVEPVSIPWRGGFELPGYVHRAPGVERPPVVVIVNALEHYKEAWHAIARRLAERGVAAVTFDAPGEGETWPFLAAPLDYGAVGSAVLDFLEGRDDVDARRAGILGISVGGTYAALAAAADPRWAACAAVSPAYDATSYVNSLPPFLVKTLALTLGERDTSAVRDVASAYSLADGVAERIACPLVVVRAGKDMLVPPTDAERLLAAASSQEKRLIDFPDANHAGVERFHESMDGVMDFLGDALGATSPRSAAAGAADAPSRALAE